MNVKLLSLQLLIVRLRIENRALLKRSPSKKLSKQWYNLLSKMASVVFKTVTCLNYGYHDEKAPKVVLSPQFEPERFPIQLYHYMVTAGLNAEISKLKILEVGCGRGGGCNYIAKQFHPKKMVGLDLSSEAINFCRRTHNTNDNLSFISGEADNLPFQDADFDVVINTESSHCYPDFDTFLNEVTCVLKPNGYFIFADFRFASAMNKLTNSLNQSALTIIKKEDITSFVVTALTKDSQRKETLINQSPILWIFKKALKQLFAGCIGSQIYKDFCSRKRIYFFYVLQKN